MREALADADDFATFAEFHGNEELIEATSKVATLLSKMRDISLKQTILDSFFLLKRKENVCSSTRECCTNWCSNQHLSSERNVSVSILHVMM